MGRGIATLVVALAFFSVEGHAAPKSLEEYWQDIDLKFDAQLGSVITERNCYETPLSFRACMNALSTIVGHAAQPVVLAPRARLVANSGFGAVVREFGPVSVVGPKRFNTESAADLYELNRRERADANNAWTAAYQVTPRVPIADIIAWAKTQPYFSAKESALTGRTLNALLAILRDPHTSYQPTAYLREVVMAPGGDSIVGIGVTLRQTTKNGHKYLVVIQPTEGGPALAAGVRARDIITHIDGASIADKALSDATALIRGAAGTAVKLTIERGANTLEIPVVRNTIRTENVVSRYIDSGPVPIGYVKLRGFMKPNGCEELEAAVRSVERSGARSLVFDLRDNGGGLLLQSVCIANLFLENNLPVVESRYLDAARPAQTLRTEKAAKTRLPMVTIINAGSASASEVVSGALQDHARSFIVGERSYGKATVQAVIPRGPLTLSSTIARFYLPSGRTNQIEGVLPDFVAHTSPSPTRDDLVAYREEDQYLALPALGTPWRQPRPELVSSMETCLTRSGRARQRFEAAQNAPLAPDYQLLAAEDVATCAVTSSTRLVEAAPVPQYRASLELPRTRLERVIRESIQSM